MKTFLSAALQRIANKDFFVTNIEHQGAPLFSDLTFEDQSSKIVIIYGDNASGKSLFSSIIHSLARDEKIAVRSASMGNRTRSGIEKAFIFGDESQQSTGATSVQVSKLCLNSMLKDDKLSLAILDEPDVGLSGFYAPAMGEYIANTLNNADDKKGLILVSHSVPLITRFLEVINTDVSRFGINTDLPLEDWLKRDDIATVDELFAMCDSGNSKETTIIRAISNRDK